MYGRREYSNAQLLVITNFLHFLSAGFVIPVLSRHIMMNGGNHILATTLHSTVYIVQELATDLLALFTHGKKFVLSLCLYFCFLCYFLLIFYNDWLTTSFVKCLLGLAIGFFSISKDYVEKAEPQHDHIKIFNTLETMKIAGYILGAVLGGYIYDCDQALISNAMFASCMTLISIFVVQELHQDDASGSRSKLNLLTLPKTCVDRIRGLGNINFTQKVKNMDPLIIYTAFIASFAAYFGRFAFLLGYNYHLSAAPTGNTTAFEFFLIFLFNGIVPFVKEQAENHRNLVENAIIISTVLLAGMFYAPTLTCHVIFSIPVFFGYTLVNSLMEDDAFGLKASGMEDAIKTLTVLLNIFIPIFCGILCDIFGGWAYKFASLVPMTLCVFMIGTTSLSAEEEISTS